MASVENGREYKGTVGFVVNVDSGCHEFLVTLLIDFL